MMDWETEKGIYNAAAMRERGWKAENGTLEGIVEKIAAGAKVRTVDGDRWTRREHMMTATYDLVYRYEYLEMEIDGQWVRVARRTNVVGRNCVYLGLRRHE